MADETDCWCCGEPGELNKWGPFGSCDSCHVTWYVKQKVLPKPRTGTNWVISIEKSVFIPYADHSIQSRSHP